MPDGFHLAAAEVYRRMAPLRDPDEPDRAAAIVNVLANLRTNVTQRSEEGAYGRSKPER